MRRLDPGFADHIATGATTLCWCWRIRRTDGVELGFTDHDVALSFEGLTFEPADGLEGGEVTAKRGAQVDTSEVLGVVRSDRISHTDIALGRFDGAEVTTWRVNWRNPAERDRQRRDTIGEITREDGRFRAELRSPSQAMNVPQGRRYQSLCDAELGDARCGVDLDAPGMRIDCEVVTVEGRTLLCLGDIGMFTAGWFGHGTANWTTGERAGLKDRVTSHVTSGSDHLVGFADSVGDRVTVGDRLTLRAGCDRAYATCRDKFANTVNFRGFPHIPGNDAVLRYPRAGEGRGGRPLVK